MLIWTIIGLFCVVNIVSFIADVRLHNQIEFIPSRDSKWSYSDSILTKYDRLYQTINLSTSYRTNFQKENLDFLIINLKLILGYMTIECILVFINILLFLHLMPNDKKMLLSFNELTVSFLILWFLFTISNGLTTTIWLWLRITSYREKRHLVKLEPYMNILLSNKIVVILAPISLYKQLLQASKLNNNCFNTFLEEIESNTSLNSDVQTLNELIKMPNCDEIIASNSKLKEQVKTLYANLNQAFSVALNYAINYNKLLTTQQHYENADDKSQEFVAKFKNNHYNQ